MNEAGHAYPWLTIEDDGTMGIDMMGCTPVEQDRRLIIVQEVQAGNLQLVDNNGEGAK